MTFKNLLLTSLCAIFFLAACHDDAEVVTIDLQQQECIKASASNNGKIIEGEYIIAASDESTASSQQLRSLLKTRVTRGGTLARKNSGLRTFYSFRLKPDEVSQLRKESVTVEPDRIIAACGCFTVVEPKTITWNIEKVGYGNGAGKTAWIVDSGIDTDHPDLTVDTKRSRSFISGQPSYDDENGHGTHVAGIIGAKNNDFGTFGVASGANLVALKVLDENGEGKLSSLLNALAYINANAKAGDVVNISISFPELSETLEKEIQTIANKGIFFALAAGNDSSDADAFSPARTSGKNIYTISAVDSLNRMAKFSNYGNSVIDFAAPGVRVPSTYKDGKYAVLSGTSMAAPHVAGILLINNGVINTNGEALSDPDGRPDPLAHQ